MTQFESCVIVDASNLNVLYKYNNRFALALNYHQCPERILVDLRAMPLGTSVYFMVMPRQKGEGSFVVNDLSFGSVVYEVDANEVVALYNLVRQSSRVDHVYLCNALADISLVARVGTYSSALYYGNRVALYTVEDKLLVSLEVFDSVQELMESLEERDMSADAVYGEQDIIDVSFVKSKYPELARIDKNRIEVLAPLIAAYRSPYKVDIAEIYDELVEACDEIVGDEIKEGREAAAGSELGKVGDGEKEQGKESGKEHKNKRDKGHSKRRRTLDASDIEVENEGDGAENGQHSKGNKSKKRQSSSKLVKKVRGRVGALNILKVGVVCMMSMVIGSTIGLRDVDKILAEWNGRKEEMQATTTLLNQVKRAYEESLTKSNQVSELYSYATNSGVAVSGLTSYVDKNILTATCVGEIGIENYTAYLARKYTVVSSDIIASNGENFEVMFTLI